jgi:opacity protein-like surface antigen
MARSFLVVLVAMLVALSGASAHASDSVWSGLVMANNVPEPTPIPAELNRFEGTLKQLFGYNQYQVIGQSRKNLSRGEDDWSASSKYFSLQVSSKPAASSVYQLNLQLFQEQKLLLATEAKLTKRSPLVIRGPQVGDGQLVLLLVLE